MKITSPSANHDALGGVSTSDHHIRYSDANAIAAVVEDTAYASGWNGDTSHAPSQNAVYDKINAMLGNGATSLAQLDIDGGTDIGEALVAADLFIVDNGAGGTNRKIAASGVLSYVQPDIRVKVRKSAAQSIANNSLTLLTFDQEVFDTNTMHDNSTNNSRLIAVTAGNYVVAALLHFDSNATGNRYFQFLVNGTAVQETNYKADQATAHWANLTNILALSADDYVEMKVKQTSGDALNVHGNGDENQGYFGMLRVSG